MLSKCVFSERKDGRRRRSSGDGDNLEEDYEQRLSKHKRSDDDEVEVRSLLPIKCKDMGVIRRTIEITKREFNSFIFVNPCCLML